MVPQLLQTKLVMRLSHSLQHLQLYFQQSLLLKVLLPNPQQQVGSQGQFVVPPANQPTECQLLLRLDSLMCGRWLLLSSAQLAPVRQHPLPSPTPLTPALLHQSFLKLLVMGQLPPQSTLLTASQRVALAH